MTLLKDRVNNLSAERVSILTSSWSYQNRRHISLFEKRDAYKVNVVKYERTEYQRQRDGIEELARKPEYVVNINDIFEIKFEYLLV